MQDVELHEETVNDLSLYFTIFFKLHLKILM